VALERANAGDAQVFIGQALSRRPALEIAGEAGKTNALEPVAVPRGAARVTGRRGVEDPTTQRSWTASSRRGGQAIDALA
jgi:hypothetical protein